MLNLPDKEIHVWYLDAGKVSCLDRQTEEAYSAALSESESRRYQRLQLRRRREQYLLGKYLVRQVLSHYRDIDPLRWQFAETEYGKPFLSGPVAEEGQKPLVFNLSHSHDMFVVAVGAKGVLGVDLEFSLRPRRIMALAKRHFSPAEIESLESLGGAAQLARFYQLWTLNEAFVKGRGLGLTMPLQDFTFLISESGRIEFCEPKTVSPGRWSFWTLQLDSRHDGQAYTMSLAADMGTEVAARVSLLEFVDGAGGAAREMTVLAASG